MGLGLGLNSTRACLMSSSNDTALIQQTVDGLPWNSEEREYRVTRGRLWRMWFGEWVRAARYISLRELIHPWLVVEQFRDQAGVVHDKLHEDLHVEVRKPCTWIRKAMLFTSRVIVSAVENLGRLGISPLDVFYVLASLYCLK